MTYAAGKVCWAGGQIEDYQPLSHIRGMAYWYITPEGARNLHTYHYTGGDYSILYRYILSPLAECLCQMTPDWVSANLVPPN